MPKAYNKNLISNLNQLKSRTPNLSNRMSTNMNNMYSAIITSMVQKMKTQLNEMEIIAKYIENMNMNKDSSCCSSTCDNDINLNILMHRFNILERRIAAVEESKNIYVNQDSETDAWLVGGEEGTVENEVIELEAEEEAVPVVVKKTGEEAAAKKKLEEEAAAKKKAEEDAAAKKKAEEDAAAKKKLEEEAAAKKRAEEEAAAKKKAKEEAAARKRAEEEVARKKAEEEARRKAEEEQEQEEEEEEEEVEEEEEEEEQDETELTEFEYKGNTYYRDADNIVYVLSEDGEPEPVGRFNEKTGGVKMFAK